jgi:hypothetical protein
VLEEEYVLAQLKAVAETGLSEDQFPETCPFTIEEALDLGFQPSSV